MKRVLLTYIHRGAPGDMRAVKAEDIASLEKSFMVLREGWGEEDTLPQDSGNKEGKRNLMEKRDGCFEI